MWQVAVYTQNLLIEGVEKDDIGIISPYRKQTQKIRKTSNKNKLVNFFKYFYKKRSNSSGTSSCQKVSAEINVFNMKTLLWIKMRWHQNYQFLNFELGKKSPSLKTIGNPRWFSLETPSLSSETPIILLETSDFHRRPLDFPWRPQDFLKDHRYLSETPKFSPYLHRIVIQCWWFQWLLNLVKNS